MIKGIQKQMIMVRLQDSTSFETAYFVLRDDFEKKSTDIVAEANLLAKNAFSSAKIKTGESHRGNRLCSLLFFISGLIIGTTIASIIWLILR